MVEAKSIQQQFPTHLSGIGDSLGMESAMPANTLPVNERDSVDEVMNVGLENFKAGILNGNADQIIGLYVKECGGFKVIQYPAGSDGSVSPEKGVLTQFLRPASDRVIALLAHNYSSGKLFDSFPIGSQMVVVFGDGHQETYRLREKERYHALNGASSQSDFIELNTGEKQSASELYEHVFGGEPHLTLQTCIQNGDDQDWGRLFLVADRVE